jgi:(p)ppGpp synthase/HD superfamily hydrolase
VHQSDCVNVKSLLAEPDRMIDVEWAPTSSSVFLVQIQVEALDRSGLLSDVTRVLSEHQNGRREAGLRWLCAGVEAQTEVVLRGGHREAA